MRKGSAAVAGAAGAAGRIFVATVGIVLLASAFAPKSDPDDVRIASVVAVPGASTFALKASDGQVTSNLTVVDGSGRPLLTLTRWPDGSLAVVPHWAGPDVAIWLNAIARSAKFGLAGASWRTNLIVHPDGKVDVEEKNEPRHGRPAAPTGAAQAEALHAPDAASPGP